MEFFRLRCGLLRICNGQENVNLEACMYRCYYVKDTFERCHYVSFKLVNRSLYGKTDFLSLELVYKSL